VIRVIESEVINARLLPPGQQCLYVRSDRLQDGSYKEFSYVGPTEEVHAVAARCIGIDLLKLDEQLRKGLTFEQALTEMGIP